MKSPVKHALPILGASAVGCVFLAASALMTGCEPTDEGVSPREPAPRTTTPTPRDTDTYDPYEDDDMGTQPGGGGMTEPGTTTPGGQ